MEKDHIIMDQEENEYFLWNLICQNITDNINVLENVDLLYERLSQTQFDFDKLMDYKDNE